MYTCTSSASKTREKLYCPLTIRILCETVKDFVAKVGKSYEKSTENTEEAESMAVKVSLHCTLLLYGFRLAFVEEF